MNQTFEVEQIILQLFPDTTISERCVINRIQRDDSAKTGIEFQNHYFPLIRIHAIAVKLFSG